MASSGTSDGHIIWMANVSCVVREGNAGARRTVARLSRAQTQERNRAKVLAAARAEFTERGFRDAKIDEIADRADLTRGAVYSNFPGKRALYFAVLADVAERAPAPPPPDATADVQDVLGAFARAWLAELPLAGDERGSPARLGTDLIAEVSADERTRRPFAQLVRFHAVLLGVALERLAAGARPGERRVRMAEAALTTLHGASRLAAAAPGVVEPFNVVRACQDLAGLDLGDRWTGPPIVPEARAAAESWDPPPAVDALRGEPADLTGDGVVTVLGLHRLSAAEDALRAAAPGARVTAVVVSGDPGELGPLARLAVAEIRGLLRHAVPPAAWPRLQVVHDEAGAIARAAGVEEVADGTERAVRVECGRIVAVAEGFGAGHAAATGADLSADRLRR
jgi:AcrR family transcriptional regulator